MWKRVLAALLILGTMLGAAAGTLLPGRATATEQYLRLELKSAYVGEYDEYKLMFVLEDSLSGGSAVAITFTQGVVHSPRYELQRQTVLIDGVACSDLSWAGSTLTVTLPENLQGGVEHTIDILPEAMVQNPWSPGGIRCTLSDSAHAVLLTSNYCVVNQSSKLAGVSFIAEESSSGVLLRMRFKTGRGGALKGTPATWNSLTSLTTYNDTITIRLSHALSLLWDASSSTSIEMATVPYGLGARQVRVVSSSKWNSSTGDTYQRQITFVTDVDIPASSTIELTLNLEGVRLPSPLTTVDTVAVWTSQEETLVRMAPEGAVAPGSEEPGDGTGTGTTDTTAPVVTWSSHQNAMLPRLVTISVTIDEDNLDEAWFSEGEDSFIHTRLWTGANTLMVVNRGGIHGRIVATDKAGNTTTVAVDIPAVSGS